MSFHRKDFVTAKEAATVCGHPDGAYVAAILVKDILDLQLTAQPSVDPTGLKGHAIIPEMKFGFFQDKRQTKELSVKLAMLASKRIEYGPTPKRDAV
jgi:hypothetical protein